MIKHWAGRYRNWNYLHPCQAAVVASIGWLAAFAVFFIA